jgi:hypothetical protein
MTRTRRITLTALVALALAVAGAGSAQAATLRHAPFCGSLHPSTGWVPITLAPGQACTFLPTAVQSIWGAWSVTKDGEGSICTAVVESPPGWPNGRPLSPTGSGPGNYWACVYPYAFGVVWQANNAFNAVYGQAVLLNYSTATIRTQLNVNGYGLIYYYN